MRQEHAQTLSKVAEPMACIAVIGNKQKTPIDWAKKACKGIVFGRGYNTAREQMKRSSFRALLPVFFQERV